MQLNGNNQTVLQMKKEARKTEDLKHIFIYYHLIQEMVDRSEIALQYVPSKDTLAEILIKRLGGPLHSYIAIKIGIKLGVEDSVPKERC